MVCGDAGGHSQAHCVRPPIVTLAGPSVCMITCKMKVLCPILDQSRTHQTVSGDRLDLCRRFNPALSPNYEAECQVIVRRGWHHTLMGRPREDSNLAQ